MVFVVVFFAFGVVVVVVVAFANLDFVVLD